MDRTTLYREEVPLVGDLLPMARGAYEAFGLFALDFLGATTLAAGFACAPTAPASLAVNVGPGRVYALQALEATSWGTYAGGGGIPSSSGLPADTNPDHQILKQGIQRDTQQFALAAPTTPGQSINYLVEAAFSESDTAAVSRTFFNAAAPSSPLSGSVSASRLDQAVVTAKAGIAATTGSQVTPAPDTGNVGLWVVTVAYGQTSVTAGNIAAYPNAPTVLTQAQLLALITACYGPANPPGIPQVTGLSAALAALTPGLAQSAIVGLDVNNNVVSPLTKLDITVGSARDSTNTTDLVLSSPITKDISAVWAAGTGNGCRDNSAPYPANSYAWVFLIWKAGSPNVQDILTSQSATAPTLPSGYTKFRRIWGVITDASGNIVPYVKTGRRCNFTNGNLIVELASGTPNGPTPTLRQLKGVPIGVKVRPIMIYQSLGTGDINPYLSAYTDPDEGVPSLGGSTQFAQIRRSTFRDFNNNPANYGYYLGDEVACSSSGQVYTLSTDTGDQVGLKTKGWVDDVAGFN